MDSITCTNTNSFLVFEPLIAKLGLNENQTVGIHEDMIDHTFGIYPNPTSGKLNIRCLEDQLSYNLTLRNVQGQKIKEFNQLKGNAIVDLNDLSEGLYLIEFSNKNWVKTSRILKTN